MEGKKILLVEDDPNFGAVLKDYLSINDFDVTLAINGMEGFEKFKKDTFDLCIGIFKYCINFCIILYIICSFFCY